MPLARAQKQTTKIKKQYCNTVSKMSIINLWLLSINQTNQWSIYIQWMKQIILNFSVQLKLRLAFYIQMYNFVLAFKEQLVIEVLRMHIYTQNERERERENEREKCICPSSILRDFLFCTFLCDPPNGIWKFWRIENEKKSQNSCYLLDGKWLYIYIFFFLNLRARTEQQKKSK